MYIHRHTYIHTYVGIQNQCLCIRPKNILIGTTIDGASDVEVFLSVPGSPGNAANAQMAMVLRDTRLERKSFLGGF